MKFYKWGYEEGQDICRSYNYLEEIEMLFSEDPQLKRNISASKADDTKHKKRKSILNIHLNYQNVAPLNLVILKTPFEMLEL